MRLGGIFLGLVMFSLLLRLHTFRYGPLSTSASFRVGWVVWQGTSAYPRHVAILHLDEVNRMKDCHRVYVNEFITRRAVLVASPRARRTRGYPFFLLWWFALCYYFDIYRLVSEVIFNVFR